MYKSVSFNEIFEWILRLEGAGLSNMALQEETLVGSYFCMSYFFLFESYVILFVILALMFAQCHISFDTFVDHVLLP